MGIFIRIGFNFKILYINFKYILEIKDLIKKLGLKKFTFFLEWCQSYINFTSYLALALTEYKKFIDFFFV